MVHIPKSSARVACNVLMRQLLRLGDEERFRKRQYDEWAHTQPNAPVLVRRYELTQDALDI